MGRPWHGLVYGLYSLTGELRYIGQTIMSAERRLAKHLATHSLKQPSHVARWLAGMVERGERPRVSALAYADSQAELDRLEIEWIRDARASGLRLTNICPGGGTSLGVKRSPETREKLRAARLGKPLPPETRRKMSEYWKGRPKPPRSAEYRANLGNGRRGKSATPEQRAAMSAARQGEKSPRARLTSQDVADIRASIAAGERGCVLAARYGVCATQISNIKHRVSWK